VCTTRELVEGVPGQPIRKRTTTNAPAGWGGPAPAAGSRSVGTLEVVAELALVHESRCSGIPCQAEVVDDRPRTFRDAAVLEERLTRLSEPHVAYLNDWVRDLRSRLGPSAIVPWFDPADGGHAASILWLLEAPGPKATRERGGSGIISCNNNDGTAENTWCTRVEAGVGRDRVVHWNVMPCYLGTATKIRAWDTGDVAAVGPFLRELLALLPDLRCVILGGGAAQATWRDHQPPRLTAHVIECPHPSPTNVNTRPGTRERIVQAWRDASESAELR
jgi:uracil-DNA glycosylase